MKKIIVLILMLLCAGILGSHGTVLMVQIENEIFMAWYYARYVERMALSAREIYDVPLYVNAAMDSREHLSSRDMYAV